jgi:trk system potassium uptake protein TrkH
MGWLPAAGHAVFHAISAFCNAGFSTFSTSLTGFADDQWTLGIVGGLVVVGGLGFVVLVDLWRRYVLRTGRRLTLHTQMVLWASAILVVGGAVLYFVFEQHNVLAGMSLADRFGNAVFMSVTARTAGFNTVDYNVVSDPSLVLTVLLMTVGGSPGSTAGGLKTTTAALLVMLLVTRMRGGRQVSVAGRTVPPENLNVATGLVVGGVTILAVAIFLLMAIETPAEVRDRVALVRAGFEAVSGFGTVGLSMGHTPILTGAGKVILTLLMFLGRVGPLTLVASMTIAGRRPRSHYRHAFEEVIVG